MKKLIWWIVILAVILCLIFHPLPAYQLAQDDSNIAKIEIVDIPHYAIIYRYNEYERIQNIKTIEEDDWDSFLTEFRKASRKRNFGNPLTIDGTDNPLLEGASIRITYLDGSFELIGYKGSLYYVSQTEKRQLWHERKQKAFEELIESYTE